VAHGTFFTTNPRRHEEKGNAEQELRELTEKTLLSGHSVSSVASCSIRICLLPEFGAVVMN
jgi:hypothetical protein